MKAPIVDGVKMCLNGCGNVVPDCNDKYCSQQCCLEFYAKHNQQGLREYASKRAKYACEICGWKNRKFPLPQPSYTGEPEYPKYPNLVEPQRPGWIEGGVGKHMSAMRIFNRQHKLWQQNVWEWQVSLEYKKACEIYEIKHGEWLKKHNAEVKMHQNNHDEWLANNMSRDFIADHIIPIAIGGDEFDLNNIQYICEVCNKKKTKRDMAKIALLRKRIKLVGSGGQDLISF
jgi:5-methylcytosine-specific restriction endonuclease McrA